MNNVKRYDWGDDGMWEHEGRGTYVLASDYSALLADRERLAADARRYQWLRSEEVNTEPSYYPFWEEANAKLCRLERLDSLIDKWMGGIQEPEPEPENELLREDGAFGVGA